ncbi:MAG: pyridoxamine 5'-phosphate oxidase family protein [Desulfoplanes sp.]|nr:pyridoxamine 5'-phosphate oxidase family protein [Desulfoplanes sp.]
MLLLEDDPAWQAKLHRFFATQKSMVLATLADSGPYCSLMAFGLTPDLAILVLATPRNTEKYRNILARPEVSLLADNRKNVDDDYTEAMAVTVLGRAFEVTHDSIADIRPVIAKDHPGMHRFFQNPDTAFIAVHVSRYVVVERFQDVQEIMVVQHGAQEVR